ncbi:MAG: M56 family metallopeptidase, partial [Vicinamibacterales bacterium]
MSASLLLQIAVKVSILLAMAWLVTRAMRRSSASARHFVWAIAIVAVLFVPVMVLVGPAWQIKILPAPLTAAPQPAAERFDAAQSDSGVGDRFESGNSTPSIPPTHSTHSTHSTGSGSTVSSIERPTGSGSTVSAVSEVSPSTQTRVEAATPASQDPIYWQPWLLGLWAAGVAFVLLRLGIGIVWVCWTARRAEPITDAAWLSILEEVTTTLQFTGRVSLRRSGRSTVPVACGIWRPTLLMPLEADDWSADRRRVVLLHELAHVKRRDCRLQAIAQVAYAWHWFNPLVHVAVARLRAEQERACDDLVLAAGTDGPVY